MSSERFLSDRIAGLAAVIVGLGSVAAGYLGWTVFSTASILAGFLRHDVRPGYYVLLVVGVGQAIVALAFTYCSLRRARAARALYGAWLLALAAMLATEVALGPRFDSAWLAAAYVALLGFVLVAGQVLQRYGAAAA